MTITAVALDLDGTLLPRGTHRLSARTVAALRAVQSSGIRVIVATGRAVCAVPPALLGGFVPDAAVYSGGALVLDGEGRTLAARCLDDQPMYALVDWCEDYDYPIAFAYPEAYYAYVGYDRMTGFYPAGMLRDGEDQDRHLEGKPFAAQCCMPPEGAAGFTERYGHLACAWCPLPPAGTTSARRIPIRRRGCGRPWRRWGFPPKGWPPPGTRRTTGRCWRWPRCRSRWKARPNPCVPPPG